VPAAIGKPASLLTVNDIQTLTMASLLRIVPVMDAKEMRHRLLGRLAASLDAPETDLPMIRERRFTVLALETDPASTMTLPVYDEMTLH